VSVAPQTLDKPPGFRLVSLPRAAGDQPQETAVAVNPRDPAHVVVSYQQAVGDGGDHHPGVPVQAPVAWTRDGGATWTVAEGATHPEYLRSIDPTIGVDARGRAYLVYIGMNDMQYGRDATTRNGEYVVRSTDGGRAWGKPYPLAENKPNGSVVEHIAFVTADSDEGSPHFGNVYVAWLRNFEDGRADEVLLCRSTDGGETWSAERVIAREAMVLSVVAGAGGVLYVLLVAFDRDVEGSSWEHGWSAHVIVSRDGGETWETDGARVQPGAPRGSLGDGRVGFCYGFARSFGWPVLDTDPRGDGRLYIAWGDCRHGDRDVFCANSDDGGQTWSDAVRVNDDPIGNGKDQLTQHLAVDHSDGSVYVVFYDRRDDAENRYPTVTLARSTDGGRTFANYAWNDTPLHPDDACFGDYIGLDARDGRVYGAWTEDVPTEPGPAKPLPTVMSTTMELKGGEFPYGPSRIRIGIADFASSPS
jgi:hypothetical protein